MKAPLLRGTKPSRVQSSVLFSQPPATARTVWTALEIEALARQCETSDRGDRALDADVYEAMGFTVRRKPAVLGQRYSRGGVYDDGAKWAAVGRVTADLGTTSAMIARLLAGTPWGIFYDPKNSKAGFRAHVGECQATASTAALALCAAILRAIARAV
jgi:hypothetical protein